MNEGVVWDFSGMSDDFPIKKDFLDYSHELSNRRMTMIYYYRGTFSFKKRLKDKTYIKKDYLRGFIPIR